MEAQNLYNFLCNRLALSENTERCHALEMAADAESQEIKKMIEMIHGQFHPNQAIQQTQLYDNDYWCNRIRCINKWLDQKGWEKLPQDSTPPHRRIKLD